MLRFRPLTPVGFPHRPPNARLPRLVADLQDQVSLHPLANNLRPIFFNPP